MDLDDIWHAGVRHTYLYLHVAVCSHFTGSYYRVPTVMENPGKNCCHGKSWNCLFSWLWQLSSLWLSCMLWDTIITISETMWANQSWSHVFQFLWEPCINNIKKKKCQLPLVCCKICAYVMDEKYSRSQHRSVKWSFCFPTNPLVPLNNLSLIQTVYLKLVTVLIESIMCILPFFAAWKCHGEVGFTVCAKVTCLCYP